MLRRWAGRLQQPDYPGGPIDSAFELDLQSSGDKVTGEGSVAVELSPSHRGGPRQVLLKLAFDGKFFHSDFLVWHYRSGDDASLQFGMMLLRPNVEATELAGRFVGFGAISEHIVSGFVVLRRAEQLSNGNAKRYPPV